MENSLINNIPLQVSEVELIYRTTIKPSMLPKITTSRDAYEILRLHWDENKIEFQEQVKVILLNRANKVLGICDLSTGGICGAIVDVRNIFQAALKSNSVGIIICHSHPSGQLKPSNCDNLITQRVKECGALLEIPLLDHIIITSEGYYSYADEGLL